MQLPSNLVQGKKSTLKGEISFEFESYEFYKSFLQCARIISFTGRTSCH